MKKQFLSALAVFLSLVILCINLCSCSLSNKNSTFSIRFIDVGQGDSALVECDGHYMLIDGGSSSNEDCVYNRLVEEKVNKLDILAISHLHKDHIGGIPKALTYASSIRRTISNSDTGDTDAFQDLKEALDITKSKITIPAVGKTYKLGSSHIEVVDVANTNNNDSLVLLITYGDTKFLFTGDIEESAQKRLYKKYAKDEDNLYKIDLIKMPHHGAYSNSLYPFLRTFMPDNVVISVGKGNQYGHPDEGTLRLLDSKTWKPGVYRTDLHGDILVKSNGKEISIETEKGES